MARYTGPSCKLCRREGNKLFLKGLRCNTDKCAIEKRNYAPGAHGKRPYKMTEYAVQLREKQKVRRIYNILEKQFRLYFQMAERQKGMTGENLLCLLERRLDNTIFRLGFAVSRREARQMVRHGYFIVNGHSVNIPSYLVTEGDVLSIKEKGNRQERIKETLEITKDRELSTWLKLNKSKLEGGVTRLPLRADIGFPIQEQAIVELYSK